MRHVALTIVALSAVILLSAGAANAAVMLSITEGFEGGASQWDSISTAPRTTLGTGYSWSGHPGDTTSAHGPSHGPYLLGQGVNALDFVGASSMLRDLNAWTTFNGDAVTNLQSISFEWLAGRLEHGVVHALIQDANSDWFLSDASAGTVPGTTSTIDATTTTWKSVAAPVINTALVVGLAGTPDLSKIYGGGLLNIDDVSAEAYPHLDTLTFQGVVPEPSTIVLCVSALVGLLCYAWRKRR